MKKQIIKSKINTQKANVVSRRWFAASALLNTLILLIIVHCSPITALAQTTEFTYQGKLNVSGSAASTPHDFEFRLCSSDTGDCTLTPANGGVLIDSDNTHSNVTVTGGIFSVKLNFTATNAFDGSNRWLDIRVKPNGSPNPYQLLSPRQPLTSAPYAVKAKNADTATNSSQLGGVAANQYVVTTDPRMTDARQPLAGSANYIQNSTSLQSSSNFNVSGNGTAGGTLSGNVVNAGTQYNIGGLRVLSVAGSNNMFAGLGAGTNTTGSDNSFFGTTAGLSNTTGSFNSFFGEGASAGATGSYNTAIGYASIVNGAGLANATAIGSRAIVSQNNSLVLGSINGFNGCSAATSCDSANVGIGTTAPLGRLQVVTANDTAPTNIPAWDTRHFVIGGAANSGGIGMSYDQTNNVGYIHSLSPNVLWRNLVLQAGGGNVGIGTGAPSTKLQIADNGGNIFIGNPTDCGPNFVGISFSANLNCNNYAVMGDGVSTYFNRPNGGAMVFRHNNSDQMVITSVGNVGIGTSSPGALLDVGSNHMLKVTNGASVEINNPPVGPPTDGGVRLVVNGIMEANLAGAQVKFSRPVCQNFNLGALAQCPGSSIRFKENVINYAHGLDLVRNLRPVSYTWKKGGQADFGLIAEEVAKEEPLLASYDEKGEIYGVRYDRTGVIAISAIKEQQAQIEAQQKLIEQQQIQINELKKLVCMQNSAADICQPKP